MALDERTNFIVASSCPCISNPWQLKVPFLTSFHLQHYFIFSSKTLSVLFLVASFMRQELDFDRTNELKCTFHLQRFIQNTPSAKEKKHWVSELKKPLYGAMAVRPLPPGFTAKREEKGAMPVANKNQNIPVKTKLILTICKPGQRHHLPRTPPIMSV